MVFVHFYRYFDVWKACSGYSLAEVRCKQNAWLGWDIHCWRCWLGGTFWDWGNSRPCHVYVSTCMGECGSSWLTFYFLGSLMCKTSIRTPMGIRSYWVYCNSMRMVLVPVCANNFAVAWDVYREYLVEQPYAGTDIFVLGLRCLECLVRIKNFFLGDKVYVPTLVLLRCIFNHFMLRCPHILQHLLGEIRRLPA